MLEVTVKTLDSQNHTFSVSEESTVKEFKEQISPVLNIPVEKQRLIFCGKVLKDDKKLNEYDVNGKVIHVVQSLPPQSNGTTASSTSGSTSTANSGPRHAHRDAAGFLLGAFTIPQDLLDPNQVQNIVQEVVSGMGELGRNATVISRNTEDGPSVDFRINLGQVPLQSEAQLRMNRTQTFFMRANRLLDSLENASSAGNNSSESSSQTDNDDEVRLSGTSRLVEADVRSALQGELNGSSRSSGDSSASAEAHSEPASTSAPAGESVSSSQPSERYGLEGLAQVAQAALTAAIATATAAARAATSTLSPSSTPTSEAQQEPTEISAEFHLAPGSTTAMDVETANPESEMETVPETPPEVVQESAANPSSGSAPAENASQRSGPSASEAAASGLASREPSQPSVQTLANLLDEVIKINHRLEPCLEKCRDIIRNDAVLRGEELTDTHRQFSKLSQLLHYLSHAYHSLSDLHINFASRPPRSPRVRIISSSPTIIQQAIPVQAQINITSSVISPVSNPSTTTTPSATTNTTATTNTQNDASPQPATRTSLPRMPDILSSTVSSLRREGGLPRIPSTSSIPAAMRGVQNPMYYMEVNPGSITIDSYMTAMDTSLGALNLPDEVTVELDAVNRVPPAATTTTSTASTETRPESQTSDSQPSTGQSRNFLPPGFGQHGTAVRHLIPVPLTSMGSLQTFDSALPCHSVWALEPSRRRHHAGQSRNAMQESQRSSRASAANASTRSAGTASLPTDTQLPGMADQTPAAAASPSPAEVAASALRSNISSILQNINVGTLAESIPMNLQQGLVGNHGFISQILSAVDPSNTLGQTIIVQDQRSSGRVSRPRSSNTSSGADSDPVVNPERYRSSLEALQMLQSSSAYSFRFTTLSDFFFNNQEIQFEDDDIIGPLFYYLCQRLTLEDFFEASLGNFCSFNRIKEPLLLYLRTKLFKARNTEEQNKVIVDKIVDNLMSLLEPLIVQLEVKAGVDYRGTMRNFLKHKVSVLKNNLTSESVPETAEFGSYICKMINQIVLEFQYLHSYCCNGDLIVFQSFFNDLIDKICTGNKACYRQVLRCLASTILTRDTMPHIDPQVVRSFLQVDPNSEFPQRPFTRRRVEDGARGRDGRSRSNLIQRTQELVQLLEQRTRSQRGMLECLAASATMDDVVIGSENWHNAVPRDWVPVITRDVQRQRRQAPQSPFSDAYLSGMPSKRRKIMTTGSAALLENSKTTLNEMLQQAITSADVKPLSSSEQVKRELSENLTLQTAFTHHMKNAIQERLQQDLDFCSEKFPNAKKYYM